MKFGKKIKEAASANQELCHPSVWLDYKALKKLLKKFEKSKREATRSPEDQMRLISENPDEQAFFLALRKQLCKVSESFKEMDRRAMAQFLQFTKRLGKVRSTCKTPSEQEVEALVTDLAQIHRHLILLRNFAVLNYCGFTKILKKHDKVTGFETKDKFMLKMVNEQPFSSHETLKMALEIVTEEYEALKDGNWAQGSAPRKVDTFKESILETHRLRAQSMDARVTSFPASNKSHKRSLDETKETEQWLDSESSSGPAQVVCEQRKRSKTMDPLSSLMHAAELASEHRRTTA